MMKLVFILCLLLLLFTFNEPATGQPLYNKTDSGQSNQDTLPESADEEMLSVKPFLSATDSLPDPFKLRQVQDDRLHAFQRDPDFAYANDSTYWSEEPDGRRESSGWNWLGKLVGNRIAQWGLFLLLLAVFVYAIYRLARENSFHWLQHRRKKTAAETGTAVPEEQSAEDLDKAIIRFAEAGNFGLAVRYMYIRLIRAALEKNILQFKSSSTNSEIVESFKDPGQARDFRYLASAYEYIFYGGFQPARDQFSVLQQKFNAFHNRMQD